MVSVAVAALTGGDVATWLGIAALAGAALAVFRSSMTTRTLEATKATVELLEASLAVERDTRSRAEAEWRERLAAQDAACQRELAELRGQLKALTADLGHHIAEAALKAWRTITPNDERPTA